MTSNGLNRVDINYIMLRMHKSHSSAFHILNQGRKFAKRKLQKCKSWKSNIFIFLTVDPKLVELQRCTIPHFNP